MLRRDTDSPLETAESLSGKLSILSFGAWHEVACDGERCRFGVGKNQASEVNDRSWCSESDGICA